MRPRCSLFVLVVLTLAASAAAASGRPRSAAPVVIRPQWRLLARGIQSVAQDGRYVFLVNAYPAPSLTGTIIDERTRGRRKVSEPGCNFAAMGGGWLLLTCSQSLVLYRLSDGHRQVIPPDPEYRSCQAGPPLCSESPDAIGRDWIEWVRSVQGGPCCSFTSYRYQRVGTTQMADDPTTTTTVPDLNTPSLVGEVCKPLKTPVSYNDHAHGRGSLSFDGGFAFASALLPPNPNPDFVNNNSGQETFLERCGTNLHQRIGNNPTTNALAVMWPGDGGPLIGLSLPRLRWLLVQPSANMTTPAQVVLTAAQQLVLDSSQRVWAAPIPSVANP